MSDAEVKLERDGKVAVVSLNRPDKKNALNEAMWQSLERAVVALESDTPRAVVVTGVGAAFCAGVDVSPDNPMTAAQMQGIQDKDRNIIAGMLNRMRDVVDRLVGLPVPLIGAINGLAYGGGAEIATRFDLRVADPEAKICFSEVRLGLMPDLGGGVALARLVGPSVAADLMLTARRVDAAEAARLGLLSRISAPGNSLEEALELAAAIAKNGPRAVRSALSVIRAVGEVPTSRALSLELDLATDLILSGECLHGVTALFNRSEPEFPDPTE